MSSETYLIITISAWKKFLHQWFGKRYEIGFNPFNGYYLLDVTPGAEHRLVERLTEFEMMVWLQQHIKVSLEK